MNLTDIRRADPFVAATPADDGRAHLADWGLADWGLEDWGLEDFFAGYGAALESGDLAQVGHSHCRPTFVVTDIGAVAVETDEIAASFLAVIDDNRARGLTCARPTVLNVARLSTCLFEVDVDWSYTGDDPVEGGLSDRYRYLMRRPPGGHPRIQVTIALATSDIR